MKYNYHQISQIILKLTTIIFKEFSKDTNGTLYCSYDWQFMNKVCDSVYCSYNKQCIRSYEVRLVPSSKELTSSPKNIATSIKERIEYIVNNAEMITHEVNNATLIGEQLHLFEVPYQKDL